MINMNNIGNSEGYNIINTVHNYIHCTLLY